jgi:glycosyltransferase 2 family protein
VIGFFVLVVVLLVHQARSVDWAGAWVSLGTYPLRTLLGAAALALASYALYCSYDLFGRHLTGHGLPVTRVVGVGFVSYAFNLNLGALVGGVAMRYRLYAGLGLAAAETTKVVMMSVVTNWLGYLLLAGVLFTLRPLELPPGWKLGSGGLRGLGAALCLLVAGYLILCFNAKRRMWTLHGRAFELPTGRIALAQLALSSLNWLTIACIVYLLFDGRIDYPSVLGVMLVAAVAGVISHIPAGLGVLEAVFLTLLAHRAAQGEFAGHAARLPGNLLPRAAGAGHGAFPVVRWPSRQRRPTQAAAGSAARHREGHSGGRRGPGSLARFQQAVDVDPLHDHHDHHHQRRAEEHAQRTEQRTEDNHGRQSQHRRQAHGPALDQRHQQTALDLLHRDEQQRDVEGLRRPLRKGHQHGQQARGNRPEEGHEFEQAGDQPERQRQRHLEQRQANRDDPADGRHQHELAEQPAAQGGAGGVESAGEASAPCRRRQAQQTATVLAQIDCEVHAGHDDQRDGGQGRGRA